MNNLVSTVVSRLKNTTETVVVNLQHTVVDRLMGAVESSANNLVSSIQSRVSSVANNTATRASAGLATPIVVNVIQPALSNLMPTLLPGLIQEAQTCNTTLMSLRTTLR